MRKRLPASGPTIVRLQFREILLEAPNVTVIRLGLVRALLREAIGAEMMLNTNGRAAPIQHTGYGDDLFLDAHGRYSPILSCNDGRPAYLQKRVLEQPIGRRFPLALFRLLRNG